MDAHTKQLVVQTLERLENSIKTLKSLLLETSSPTTPKSGSPINKNPKFYATSLPTKELGPTPDFESEDWPMAVDPTLIVPKEGESEKQYRALQIVGLMKTPLENKVVLDCGCGEGYNSREMANTATKVVGYDIKEDSHWPGRSKDNIVFTTDRVAVTECGPYDFIVLYDVLDHLQGEDPEEFMKWIASLLKENSGRVFVRTHPWTSKTGGHHYRIANKAWIHLALTPDELVQAGLHSEESNLRIIRPMAAYESWFKNAGLTVINKDIKNDDVRGLNNKILERIIKVTWAGTVDLELAKKIMANHWIDYFLAR